MVEIDPLTGLPKELLALEEIGKEQQLSTDQQRLEKLWDAYEQQEKDLNAALDRSTELERILERKNTYPEVGKHVFKLPDIGEGVVEGEIVKWNVKPGDTVKEDEPLVEIMTDKATVAIPSKVNGKVVSTTGKPGDMIPVGAELIVFEVDGAGSSDPEPEPKSEPKPETKGKQTKIIENIESVTDSKLSNVEQMEKLIQLRNNGGITHEEFEEMKREIIG